MVIRVLALGLLLLGVRSAQAQEAPDRQAQVQEARRLHDLGRRAADAGDWPGATGFYERALSLVRRSTVAFSYAEALHRSGRAVEAQRVIVAMGEGAYGRLPRTAETRLRPLAIAVRREVALLVVRVPDGAVWVNAERAAVHDGVAMVWVAPGSHRVRAEGLGESRRIEVAGGDERSIEFSDAVPPVSRTPSRRRRRVAIALGVLAGAAAATTLVWYLSRPRHSDAVWGRASTLVQW